MPLGAWVCVWAGCSDELVSATSEPDEASESGQPNTADTGEQDDPNTGETDTQDADAHCPDVVWTHVAPPPVARKRHAMLLLEDGRVLVSGGRNGETFASGELWDPELDTWTAIAPMAQARWAHRHVQLLDGRVLALGGYQLGLAPERWDPELDTWTSLAPGPELSSVAGVLPLANGAVLVSAWDALLLSHDGGESWTPIAEPPLPANPQYPFSWGKRGVVFATWGYEAKHSFVIYDWRQDSWSLSPERLFDFYEGVYPNAWGPLSANSIALLRDRPGNDPDPTPVPASFTYELHATPELTWLEHGVQASYFGGFGSEAPTHAFWPGWLYVNGKLYDSHTRSWCASTRAPLSLYHAQRVLLDDGRMLFTGDLGETYDGPSEASAMLWTPSPAP